MIRNKIWRLGSLTVLLSCAPLSWAIDDGVYTITSKHSGKLVEVGSADTADGANVIQWSANGGATQQWEISNVGGDDYSVINVNSGKVMEVYDFSAADGGNVTQWDYWGGESQTWTITDQGDDYFSFINKLSGKSLDLLDWDTSDGANIAQWEWWGGDTQLWALDPVGGNNPDSPDMSAGCGNSPSLTEGRHTIISSGIEREYFVTLPSNYDPNEPYRLFYVSHGLGGVGEHVYNTDFLNWFGLRTQALRDNVQAIWIAPTAIDRWDERDHPLFDDILNLAKNSLCVDNTRVFVAGMSFGGMISYSLSTNHQDVIRAGFGMSPANFNIWLPNPKLAEPIAWMQTTGMDDPTTPWDAGGGRGAMYIGLEKARDNGCNVPNTIETWAPGSPSEHLCVDMQGCDEGYPVKVCTFNGGHIHDHREPGAAESWIPEEAWDFFMQF